MAKTTIEFDFGINDEVSMKVSGEITCRVKTVLAEGEGIKKYFVEWFKADGEVCSRWALAAELEDAG